MERKNLFIGCCVCLVLISLATGAGPPVKPISKKTYSQYLYRIINWCIVGRGEYELNEWPFVQFRPFLQEDHKIRSFKDNNITHDKTLTKDPVLSLQFDNIRCDEDKSKKEQWVGDENGNYLQRIHVKLTSDVPLQGLIIQANHAPFGLGFPFGQFDESSEFECKDCKYLFSAIIGCISRPGGEFLHPTVGAFHHKYRHPSSRNRREVGKQKEIHWNFKWVDNKCSSSQVVEFWVLVVLNFEQHIWYARKFGPYNFQTDAVKRISVADPKIPAATSSYIIYQPGVPSVILPRCQKRLPPTPLPLIEKCVTEPEAHPTECPTEIDETTKLKTPLPSEIACHTDEYKGLIADPDPSYDKSNIWSHIRMAGGFDRDCLSKYSLKNQPYKVCPEWRAKYVCTGSAEDFAQNEPQLVNTAIKKRVFPDSYCNPCVTLEPTLEPAITEESLQIIKRHPHTVIMITAFFFVLPISGFIARFYKETFHTMEFKGWRLWLLIHGISGIFILLLCYASYSVVTFWKLDAHMITGYGAVFCCAGGFFSGWGRHKEFHTKWFLIVLHLACGYSAYGLALTSYVVHRRVGHYSRWAAYASCGLSVLAMIVMTFHVWAVDRKLGVIPTRWHIPIISIRFDDVFPLGHRFRIVVLIVYAILLFALCCAMLCLE